MTTSLSQVVSAHAGHRGELHDDGHALTFARRSRRMTGLPEEPRGDVLLAPRIERPDPAVAREAVRRIIAPAILELALQDAAKEAAS